ncbi:MAG: muramoyltetrapeptide carboxypeptidase [Bacteroidetes bacterium]|nr:MAG: muramoyltetrapeptide carboxypeptidase [Bacteroidota bacterium]
MQRKVALSFLLVYLSLMSDRRDFLQGLAAASLLLPLSGFAAGEIKSRIRAPRLDKGDLVALTAPAGAIFNEESISKVTVALEAAGFRVQQGKTLQARYGYLAGKDEFRANELNALFKNKEVKAIMAMRGGWGCARLLHLLDFAAIERNPKIITGFSDITTLLLAIFQKTGLITFHGPVGNSSLGEFTMDHFLRIVSKGERAELKNPVEDAVQVITPGKARGILCGGNLTVICSLVGSGYLPDWKDKILFIEETDEEPYAVDRMLTQLKLAGILTQVKAVVFGKCTKCDPEEPEKSLTLQQVFDDHLRKIDVPVFTNSSFGHTRDKFTIPVGAEAEVDAATGIIRLLEVSVN